VLAVPATAGTGSEATNNAVLSRTGPDGFKKSLRHENYVPDHAFLDPELQRGAPALVTLSAGLDAVTQLLEAYVSTQANPVTDAVAREGLVLAGASLPRLSAGEDSTALRGGMGLAAFLSGVALAGAGLGAVHGLASPVGALRDIPHGVVCGRLAAPVTRRVVASLKESGADESVRRYAEAAGLFLGAEASGDRSTGERIDLLVRRIEALADALPTFSAYGFVEADLDGLAERAGLKNTPAALSRPDLVGALRDAL
jgi:alcohol dehydrogenase class IV